MATVANADVMRIVLNLNDSALFFEVLNDRLTSFHSVHSGILAPFGLDVCVVCKCINYFKVMSEANLKVVRVMSRCDLNAACSEVHFNIVIGNDRDLSVNDRKNKCLADDILVSFIVRVNCNCGIAEHCLGSCRCKLKIAASVLKRITKMPEVTCLILIFNLGVRN